MVVGLEQAGRHEGTSGVAWGGTLKPPVINRCPLKINQGNRLLVKCCLVGFFRTSIQIALFGNLPCASDATACLGCRSCVVYIPD